MRKSGKIILGLVVGLAVIGAGVLINYIQGRDYLYGDDFEDGLDD